MAASFFSPVRFVGVVGDDCSFDLEQVFTGRNVDLAGLEIRQGSKTFRWTGTYHENMDDRTTDSVELNVLAESPPKVPEAFKDSKFVFLANTAPALQKQLLEQIDAPEFVAVDTMNLWIENDLEDLKELLKEINCLIINEDEARQLACEHNLIKASKIILDMGPAFIVIKKGESGSLLFSSSNEQFVLPAYPAEQVIDPTGAGDSYAGGFMGYLAQQTSVDFDSIKKAVAYGTVTASFTIAGFSLSGLDSISKDDIDNRFEILRKITSF
jgi:sugar/nucleoside kinase (ribokinase family)